MLDDVESLMFAEDVGHVERYLRDRGEFGGWAQGSRSIMHMTEAELKAFHDAYLALLKRFGHALEDAPDGARPILLRWFALPVEQP